MKDITLMHCLAQRACDQFAGFFEDWQALYRQPKQGEVDDTFNVFFHALAGIGQGRKSGSCWRSRMTWGEGSGKMFRWIACIGRCAGMVIFKCWMREGKET